MAPHFPVTCADPGGRPPGARAREGCPPPSTPPGTVDSGAVRVLIAEDDENLGEVLARGLKEQGYVVDLVPDGETAASYLRFYQYEVAVLDWRMLR
jgi:Response regulator receiver domain